MTLFFIVALLGGFGFTIGRLAYDEWKAACLARRSS